MNNKKKIGFVAISFMILLSVILSVSLIAYAIDNGTEGSFDITAASVRTVNDEYDAGIRFQILMDKTMYDSILESKGTVEAGAKMIPAYLLGNDTIAAEANDKIATATASTWNEYAADTTKMEGIVYVYNIPASSYGTDLVIAGYAVTADGVEYTSEKTFTLAEVAQATVSLDETKADALKGYYTFAVSIDGVASTAVYGDKLACPNTDKLYLNGKKSAIWDFDSMTVAGNVTLTSANAIDSVDYSIKDGNTVTLSGVDGALTSVVVGGKTLSGTTLNASALSGLAKGDEVVVYAETASGKYATTMNVWSDIITSTDEFFAMEDDLAGYYKLGDDLDFSAQVINSDTTGEGWNSIGWKSGVGDIGSWNRFTGVFDGDGYALKNITAVGYNATQGIDACVFGYIEGATIKNVMVDLTLGSVGANSVKVAGFVGTSNNSTIDNCFVNFITDQAGYGSNYIGSVAAVVTNGGTISNCVGILDTSAGFTSSNKNTLGTICGAGGSGSIVNSYGYYIGAEGDSNIGSIDVVANGGNKNNSANYTSFASLMNSAQSYGMEYLNWNAGKACFGDEEIDVVDALGSDTFVMPETKLVTLNMRLALASGGNIDASPNTWGQRMQVILDWIETEDPDIICFQEAQFIQFYNNDSLTGDGYDYFPTTGNGLAQLLSSEYSFIMGIGSFETEATATNGFPANYNSEFMVIAYKTSKYNISEDTTLWYAGDLRDSQTQVTPYLSSSNAMLSGDGYNGEVSEYYTVHYAKFTPKTSGQSSFYIYNAHLSPNGPELRKAQYNLLMPLFNEHTSNGELYFAFGDWNETPNVLNSYNGSVIDLTTAAGPTLNLYGTAQHRVDYIWSNCGFTTTAYTSEVINASGTYLSDHWPVTAVIAAQTATMKTSPATSEERDAGQYVINDGDFTLNGLTGTVTSVSVGGTDISASCTMGLKTLTIPASVMQASVGTGAKEITVKTSANVTYTVSVFVVTDIITTPAEFFAIGNDLTGYYVLGNDLDFSGNLINGTEASGTNAAGWKTIAGEFKGVLDGNGYALKNLTVTGDTGDRGIAAALFYSSNAAVFKNLYVDMTLSLGAGTNNDSFKDVGFVRLADYGTEFNNCVVVLHTQWAGYGSNYVAPFGSTAQRGCKFINCIGILDTSAGILSTNKTTISTLAGNGGGDNSTITNSYGIHIGATGDTWTPTLHCNTNKFTVTNSTAYKGFDAFCTAHKNDMFTASGWSNNFKWENKTLSFGDEVIYTYIEKIDLDAGQYVVSDGGSFTAQGLDGTVTKIEYNGSDVTSSCDVSTAGQITVPATVMANLAVGEQQLTVTTSANVIYNVKILIITDIITTTDEFFAMKNNLAGYYVLGQDLDFSAQGVNSTVDGNGWNTIGWKDASTGDIGSYSVFTGTFDGNGYALKNITIYGYGGPDGNAINPCLFGYVKNATFKNVMADITVAAGSGKENTVKFAGLIGRADYTTIDNCVVTLHTQYTAYGSNYNVAPIAGQLAFASTVSNSIGILDTSAGILSSNKANMGTIVGQGGGDASSIINSYGIYIGASGDTYVADVKYNSGTINVTNSTAYNGFDAFCAANSSDMFTATGWSNNFKFENSNVMFGDEVIYTYVQEIYVGAYDLSAQGTFTTNAVSGTVTKVMYDGNDVTSQCVADGAISVPYSVMSTLGTGEKAFRVTVDGTDYMLIVKVATKVITTPAEFFAIGNDLTGYYVLGNDLDFSGNLINGTEASGKNAAGWKTIAGEFKGVLDGNGYALKNLTVTGDTGDRGIAAALFYSSNAAVFKNLYVDMTLSLGAGTNNDSFKEVGFVRLADYGTEFNNCVVVLHTQWAGYGSNYVAPFGSIAQRGCKFINCVGILDTSAGILSTNKTTISTLAGYGGGDNGVITNSYGIHIGATDDTWTPTLNCRSDKFTETNSTAYKGTEAFTSAVTSLPEADGWSDDWSLEGGTLTFGDETIIAAE